MGIIRKWKWWVFVCDELIESFWSCDKLGWDWMETIWNHTFIIELCVVLEEHPGFNEYSLTQRREMMTRIMFESFVVFQLIVSMRWTQNRDCHCHWWWCLSNCVCKWQLCSSWLYFTFLLLEGMTLMNLWLNWLINMVTQ